MAADKDHLDLAATLRAVGAVDVPAPVVDALFFHRTLARWLGLPEGKVDGVSQPVQWDYRYWKAELRREPEHDSDSALAWCAELFATVDDPVEVVRWWVVKDDRGRITDAGWHSEPPQVRGPAPTRTLPPTPDAETLARLFSDDDG
jgi:hypothetical protein